MAGCCARAGSGHAAVAPPSRVMNSRPFSSCLRDEANSLAQYRATSLQRTKIRLLVVVQGHSRHSRHPGVSGSPQERTFGQWPVASIRTAIATPVPMGSPGWRDVGRRARFKFFLGGNFADGRVASTAVPETFAMVDGRWSADARRSRLTSRLRTADPETLPDGRWLLASRWSEQRAPDAPAHLDAPRGVLRRSGEHVEGNLRRLRQGGGAGAWGSRGDAASRPARRSRLLRGFRRKPRPPVPKPSVAAKPSPADSCRAPPRSPAATECRAGASASGSWNAAPAYSRRRHGRKGRHALAPSSRLRRRGAPERGQIWQTL